MELPKEEPAKAQPQPQPQPHPSPIEDQAQQSTDKGQPSMEVD